MADNSAAASAASKAAQRWRTIGWVVLGAPGGAALVLLFLAYGQPALLHEQTNLRYCG